MMEGLLGKILIALVLTCVAWAIWACLGSFSSLVRIFFAALVAAALLVIFVKE